MTEIDFYILGGQDHQARLAFAARLAEKMFLSQRQLVIATADPQSSQDLSEQLWQSRPESFIAHGIYEQQKQLEDPVVLCHQAPPTFCHDVLINISGQLLESHFSRFHRLVEIVVQTPEVLEQTRAAYQFYKARGYPIRSHDLKTQRQ